LVTAAAVGIIMTPFDMGITMGTVVTGAAMNFSTLMSADIGDIEFYDNDTVVKTMHEGREYYVSSAQLAVYNRLAREIRSLENDYEMAMRADLKRKAKKIERKARKLKQYQYDIMASKNVCLVEDQKEIPKMNLNINGKKPPKN